MPPTHIELRQERHSLTFAEDVAPDGAKEFFFDYFLQICRSSGAGKEGNHIFCIELHARAARHVVANV